MSEFFNGVVDMTQAIIDNPDLLQNKTFVRCWLSVITDFTNTADKYNGGNGSGYNLRRAGRRLEAIWATAHAIASGKRDPSEYRIDWILGDIKEIIHKVEWELEWNTKRIHPGKGFVDEDGVPWKYRTMGMSLE
ncbi:MAG: hypothetical protein ACXADB_06075 [Candidatus Hermodarchaeia archaeon]|jgi:hypothetical protein